MNLLQQSYDKTPYKSSAHAQSSIYNLEAIATFLGLKPTPVNKARILEIGCSFGGNLIPMALANPDSEFIGIDISATQINHGKNLIQELGIKNIKLIQQDILALAGSFRDDATPPPACFSIKI